MVQVTLCATSAVYACEARSRCGNDDDAWLGPGQGSRSRPSVPQRASARRSWGPRRTAGLLRRRRGVAPRRPRATSRDIRTGRARACGRLRDAIRERRVRHSVRPVPSNRHRSRLAHNGLSGVFGPRQYLGLKILGSSATTAMAPPSACTSSPSNDSGTPSSRPSSSKAPTRTLAADASRQATRTPPSSRAARGSGWYSSLARIAAPTLLVVTLNRSASRAHAAVGVDEGGPCVAVVSRVASSVGDGTRVRSEGGPDNTSLGPKIGRSTCCAGPSAAGPVSADGQATTSARPHADSPTIHLPAASRAGCAALSCPAAGTRISAASVVFRAGARRDGSTRRPCRVDPDPSA